MNPGSFDAVSRQGCSCDQYANQFGRGIGYSTGGVPVFEVDDLCRVHGEGTGWRWMPPAGADAETVSVHDVQIVKRRRGRPAKPERRCPDCGHTRKLRPSGLCNTCTERHRYRERKAEAGGG